MRPDGAKGRGMKPEKALMGWREWVSLPQLGIKHIKAKVDTGARTSALHAVDPEIFRRRGKTMVRFTVNPLQRDSRTRVQVEAEVWSVRKVRSSSGHEEDRIVIRTPVRFTDREWPIEITLTSRDSMGFRMLLGRQAVRGQFVVDPGRSFCGGRPGKKIKKKKKKTTKQAVSGGRIARIKSVVKVKKTVKRQSGPDPEAFSRPGAQPVNIGILSRKASLYSTSRLVEAAEARGHEVQVVDYLRCYMNIASHRPKVIFRGHPLPDFDAVIPRIGASHTFYGTAVVRQFEMMGVFPLNESQGITRSRDKLRCLQLLSRKGIGLPVTGFANYTQDIQGLIEIVGGAPLIIKLLEGTQGIGVVLAETDKAAESVIQAFRGLDADILVQEYVKESEGADIRCFVIGDRVVASMMRSAPPGEFRSNLHRGGAGSKIKLTPEERSTAVRAAKAMGLNVAGVDLIRFQPRPPRPRGQLVPRARGNREDERSRRRRLHHRLHREERPPRKDPGPGEGLMAMAMAGSTGEPLEIGGRTVLPGKRLYMEIPVARIATQDQLALPVAVVHGKAPGPRLWISGAIHGDELNGIDIAHRVLESADEASIRGTLIVVPIVNVFGFIHQSRYLPDRRDLNRTFPGSPRGSLAARMAHLFLQEIVERSTHGIDLHTAASNRGNLPQIRGDFEDPETRRMAEAFGAPVMIHSKLRDGSLRKAGGRRGIPVVVYEGGEANRFNQRVIRTGVNGVRRVMAHLGMTSDTPEPESDPVREARSSYWVRARRSGILRLGVRLGETVAAKQRLGVIRDSFGRDRGYVQARAGGIVVGLTFNPLIYQGDGLVHIAEVEES